MAFTSEKWDGSPSNWPDTGDGRTANFCRSCLINTNTGDPKDWTQDNCKLPVKTPDGDVNTNAMSAAAAALAGARGGVQASSADKKSAAKKLLSYYRGAKMEPPDSLTSLAQ
jgi:hypothetical protein